ncbi:MAG: DUF4838 domain-containing protein [Verrucomicrobiales bacterium]|nr:DUF4838 domain-containing protein [Verrucomicrobiales bacterium]
MNQTSLLLAAALVVSLPRASALTLATQGATDYEIVTQAGATPAELNAARELAETLEAVTGAVFPVREAGDELPPRAIVVGPGPVAQRLAPELPIERLGLEEIVIETRGDHLLLLGGRPRGTLYAVNHFLQQYVGVRWWTPWATFTPRHPTLHVGQLRARYQPPFESRDPFWYPAFNARWAVRNYSNSQSAAIPEDWGGAIRYRGFVHTFYPLVPPEEHFAKHPEWYSLRDGKRTHDRAQLCLTNPELRAYVVERVRQWLRESPEARIVSVSQNDWYGACECEKCKALDTAEGSHAGTMLDFVNHVAEQIEAEFPLVAVDTLAYQYTRQPPKTIKPRPNVIVRLCSIECNFREPLDHPVNAKFADDIRGWEKISDRLYIWDYTTDFAHYVQPHPNWFVLGPNVRFFAAHHVKGLFEQGAYQSHGSEFSELRAWVLAQLLWNPQLDDRALIREFLEGYYGPAAARPIQQYLELLHTASEGWNLTCFSRTDTTFHDFKTLAEAERLWREAEAEAAVAGDRALRPRVERGRMWLGYVWLSLWEKLRQQCTEAGATWPLPASRKAFADQWLKLAQGEPGLPWTQVTHINESGVTPAKFVERFAND